MTPIAVDMEHLRRLGIRLVVTLTELPLRPPAEEFGLRGLHFPIEDMSVPTPRPTAELCREVLGALGRLEGTLLHCKAGLGRTGTMLACCLVARGDDASAAITTVRKVHPGYIQNTLQEQFVHHFEQFWQEQAVGEPLRDHAR